MPTLDQQELRRLARLGAIARLKQLEEEAAAIRKMFPGLKVDKGAAPAAAPSAAKARPRRRKMSAEARKAAAERMRAYWAKRKAGATAAGSPNDQAADKTTRKRATRRKAKRGRK